MSSALGGTLSLNDDVSIIVKNLNIYLLHTMDSNFLQDSVSECREICAQEEEEMRKIQSEGVQLLMQQQEDEMRKIKSENQKKEEELKKENREEEETLKLENQKKEQKLTKENRENEEAMQAENERALDLLLEENATQLALMLAKHEVEKKAARKEAELEAERNASASNQPQVPECPVSS